MLSNLFCVQNYKKSHRLHRIHQKFCYLCAQIGVFSNETDKKRISVRFSGGGTAACLRTMDLARGGRRPYAISHFCLSLFA